MVDQSRANIRPGMPGRVILWMVPRTVSTAFARCMGGIPECEVWMEPLGFCSFASSLLQYEDQEQLPVQYEGNEEVYARAAAKIGARYLIPFPPERLSASKIKHALESSPAKYVFVKDESVFMTSDGQFTRFIPEGFRHAFLIRDPTLAFASLHKGRFSLLSKANLLPEGMDERNFDVRGHDAFIPPERFYESQHALWKYVRAHVDPDAIVIDSSDLLTKPAEMLPKFCEAVGLPYSDSLLEWDATIESAKSWKWASDDLVHDKNYLSVSMSTGKFLPPRKPPPRDELTDDVIALSEMSQPFYQEMFNNRIIV